MTPVPLTIRPATRARWPDLERLFGERGACGGCWCMVWRRSRAAWVAGKGASNRAALRRLTARPIPPGILGFEGRDPVAWCAVAPRAEYSALARSRVLKPVDETPVWSISCLFVRKDRRRDGIAVAMLAGAVRFAAKHGAVVVEGYPVVPWAAQAPATFLWTGTLAAFERAGFAEVARFSKSRPIVRAPARR